MRLVLRLPATRPPLRHALPKQFVGILYSLRTHPHERARKMRHYESHKSMKNIDFIIRTGYVDGFLIRPA